MMPIVIIVEFFCAKNITVLLREPFLNCLRTTQGGVEPVPPFDLNSST